MTEQKAFEAFSHEYRNVGDVKLHTVTVGEGAPVLLIPGWPQTWYVWRHVMVALAGAGFRAVAVDPRGLGQSSRPSAGYDMATVAAELNSLMHGLGHQRYRVVGHDIGMWIGYAMASDFPAAVERVVLIDAGIPGIAPPAPIFGPPEKLKFRWHFLFNQLQDLPEFLISGREREYLSWMFEQWAVRRERVAVDTYIDAYASPGALRGGFSYYRAIPETIQQNTKRKETKLKMPVLAIGGEHSAGDGSRAMMEPIAENLKGAVISACGHIVPEEAHEDLIDLLKPFLTP